ncbi:hypothetical protein [Fusobacterium varium]|uniref:Uncharacterized protein n=1 Tax=Fusobacterium varium ATCC 27725 TaxID=469618 RepID=A0ABN5JMS6_FUSVA|nr:hypothetical protein [Fusobacterium varium]AVQ32641.1 hypothetical protein C4N18_15450 [Fusobacterium varium ATCC 27725]EES63590.1 hypothetical protein FVAG_02951 [Fusobacterium varium ATCC 27725]
MNGIITLIGQALGIIKKVTLDGKDKADIEKQKITVYGNPLAFIMVIVAIFLILGQIFNWQISDWFYHIFEKMLDYAMSVKGGVL